MKITGMEVDGYGVWSGLKLERLSGELNVLYGPNEAGKTTLLQFVRSILYGFSPGRQKYLPPIRGGRPGGSLELDCPGGQFHLQRYHDSDAQADQQDQLTLLGADGTRHGEHLVKALLSDVDEATYNNVFAVGLREIQELGTLGDTEAATMLYSLTAGLDRISLVDVMRELQVSRNRILDRDGGSCQVSQLLEHREQLRTEIEELGKLTRQYERLATQRSQFQRDLTRLEEENTQVESQARVVELALSLRSQWARRSELDDELATLGPLGDVSEDAVRHLDAINDRLQRHQQRRKQFQQQREQLRKDVARMAVNQALLRQAPRIEALQDQQPWIATLQKQCAELESETARLQADLEGEQRRLGFDERVTVSSLPVVTPESMSRLRPAAKALKQCRRQVTAVKEEVAAAGDEADSLDRQIASALTAQGHTDLTTAMDQAGSLVAQLRRRVQVDERLDQMTQYEKELEQQIRRLAQRQILPAWILVGLGAAFVPGVVMIMAGLFMPESITGSLGWAMALLGLAGSGVAAAGKVLLERSNARRLDICEKQLGMLQLQIRQATEERETLDTQLSGGSGSLAVRLQTAEEELASLEELAPFDTRQRAARQEAVGAGGRLNMAEHEAAKAVRHWQETLRAVGLPPKLTPRQVRQFVGRSARITELQRQFDSRREEFQHRRREFDALLGRIEQLLIECEIDSTTNSAENGAKDETPTDQLRRLSEVLAEQEKVIQGRNAARKQARDLRRKLAKYDEAISRLQQRRRRLLREADAADEQEFRRRVVQAARGEVLRRDRDSLEREIKAAIAGSCPENAIREQLRTHSDEELKSHRDQLLEQLGTCEERLQERFERRGRLSEQLATLAKDTRLATKQLEMAVIEKRLEDAIDRWRVLALTCRILDTIRTLYEKERQPETLQEASDYLDRLTRGRYCRVWTRLGEDVLLVDDAEGESLPVEVLSRGTREQLFLALRLALAASYARRGALLPLILDDVLVNFDTDRAKAAARVLRDFAAAGHQVLVFTCHEHILKLFKSLKVPVSRLPDNAAEDHPPIVFEQPAKPKRSAPKAPTPTIVDHPAEESPDQEIAEDPEDEPAEDEIAEADSQQVGLFDTSDEEPPWDDDEGDDEEAEEDDELDGDEEEGEDDEIEDIDDEKQEYEWEDDEEEDEEDEDGSAEAA